MIVFLFLNFFPMDLFANEVGRDQELVVSRMEKAHKRLEKHGGRDQYVTVFSDQPSEDDKKSFERPDGSIVLDKEDPTKLTWRSSNEKNELRVVNRERKQRARITKRIIVKGTPEEVASAYEFLKSNSATQGIVAGHEDLNEAGASIIDCPRARLKGLKQAVRALKERGYTVELELLNDRRFHAK